MSKGFNSSLNAKAGKKQRTNRGFELGELQETDGKNIRETEGPRNLTKDGVSDLSETYRDVYKTCRCEVQSENHRLKILIWEAI